LGGQGAGWQTDGFSIAARAEGFQGPCSVVAGRNHRSLRAPWHRPVVKFKQNESGAVSVISIACVTDQKCEMSILSLGGQRLPRLGRDAQHISAQFDLAVEHSSGSVIVTLYMQAHRPRRYPSMRPASAPAAQLIGDDAPLVTGGVAVILGKHRADPGRDNAPVILPAWHGLRMKCTQRRCQEAFSTGPPPALRHWCPPRSPA
jgi:hypothetical protein